MRRFTSVSLVLAVLFGSGCATLPQAAQPIHVSAALARSRPQSEAAVPPGTLSTPAGPRLAAGLDNLRKLTVQTSAIEKEFGEWWQGISRAKKRALTSEESDRAGSLLFRYMVAREMLWNMVSVYTACDRNVGAAETQTKAFVIGYGAAVLMDAQSARLVNRFISENLAVDTLNEIHLRYDIPANTFDAIFLSVTSPANIQAIREAHKYVTDEMKKSDSLLAHIVQSEPDYAELLQRAGQQFVAAKADTDQILRKKSLVLPAVANLLRQNRLTAATRRLARKIGDNLYVAQGILFNTVSDIKRPMTLPVDFNPDQVKLIKSLLQPGDTIFTFTAGYMSNVFLPGRFKHGLTYIGTPEQRAAAGLTVDAIRDVPPGKRAKLEQDLGTAKLPSGYDADVVEAVAEGVIFNSLDYLLKHHVNRIAVLRPRVSADERVQALGTVFLLLGGVYDFNFDFVDPSYLCCTEVIYRAYNKKGTIDFPLVQRLAVKTLAADDIIKYHLAADIPKFDFVVFAEEDPGSPIHMASVFTGAPGAERLRALMTDMQLEEVKGAKP